MGTVASKIGSGWHYPVAYLDDDRVLSFDEQTEKEDAAVYDAQNKLRYGYPYYYLDQAHGGYADEVPVEDNSIQGD